MTTPATEKPETRRVTYGEPVRKETSLAPSAIYELLKGQFSDGLGDFEERGEDSTLWVEPAALVEVSRFLKNDPRLRFDFLMCQTGIDWGDRVGVVYHLFSYAHRHRFGLKVGVSYARPHIPSVVEVWKAANWQEREAFDLLGIVFLGHPDLRRILMPDDWVGFPMRKDYKESAEYHGIPTTRPNPLVILEEHNKQVQEEWRAKRLAEAEAEEAVKKAAEEKAAAQAAAAGGDDAKKEGSDAGAGDDGGEAGGDS